MFSRAGPDDGSDILRLLRDNPLAGRFSIGMEREPDPFASDFGLSPNHLIVIARNADTGEAAGMCERTVFDAFVNGRQSRLPYIGGLRADPAYRHRPAAIRGGFEALRVLGERDGELPCALTSITSDNHVARRLLTAGLKGFPRYDPVGDYITFVMRTRKQTWPYGVRRATPEDLPEIADLLQRTGRRQQCSFAWTEEHLRTAADYGLPAESIVLQTQGSRLTGCLAVWDQTAFRQSVIRGYPPGLGLFRPLVNLAAPIIGFPRLPPVGQALRTATLSLLASAEDDRATFSALLRAALSLAREMHLDQAALGLAAGHNVCEYIARESFVLRYRTTLYLIHWTDREHEFEALDTGLVQPELGLL